MVAKCAFVMIEWKYLQLQLYARKIKKKYFLNLR